MSRHRFPSSPLPMELLLERLQSLTPTIKEICRISGTPGISLGVLHHGEVIYTNNFGFRNVATKTPPDEDTLYYIASMSKAYTAAGIAILVEQKKLKWETPVSNILPDFLHPDASIRENASMVDFLSHRSGLASANAMWFTEFGHLALPIEETVRFASHLDVVHPFRQKWLYSNWGYGLADLVVEKLTGKSWGQFQTESIFHLLGMVNTTVHHVPESKNFAEGYMSLSNGTPYHVPRPELEDGKILGGAAAIQTNVRESLIFYKSLLEAAESQKTGSKSSSPLKEVPKLFQPHIPLEANASLQKRSYALGWVRTELPGALGKIGQNSRWKRQMPLVGKGLEKPRLCLYHEGSLLSFLSSVHLLPDSQSAIVVLTNSMANSDVADWVGEMLLEAVLDNPDKNDYLQIAKETIKSSLSAWPRMAVWLEERREPGTSPQSLQAYEGIYWNGPHNWSVEIFVEKDQLTMCFQGNREQTYALHHYHHDVFSWLLTRDENVIDYGRFPVTMPPFYLISFQIDKKTGVVKELLWKHDGDVPAGETFWKDSQTKMEL
ncbi:beta-lactamase/transpeptidase-like protein [Microthyrium microscopicum]|uniref:Beta-lactamase/transpeptidase-like protein n=1 Tax=Microthyrium microscopicum TaxID=703497 RepID=A0A6A6U605_9PEZI|nr:beta-lactamase/transpeptidase-like protein [Microthyrium microscopicum]